MRRWRGSATATTNGEHSDRSATDRRLQLRCRQIRGHGAARSGQLLPLQTVPETQRSGGIAKCASRPRHIQDRVRPRPTAGVEARRRRREVVLRHVWLLGLRPQPSSRGPDRDPHGHPRRRPRDRSKRSSVRRVRSTLGANPQRRAATPPRESPRTSRTLTMGQEPGFILSRAGDGSERGTLQRAASRAQARKPRQTLASTPSSADRRRVRPQGSGMPDAPFRSSDLHFKRCCS